MTNETEKLFDAPWEIQHCDFGYDIVSAYNSIVEDRIFVAHADNKSAAKRIARLPEMYDALLDAAGGKCWSCAGVNVDTVLVNRCPKGHDGDCYVAKWIELLRKVRDGK